MSYAIIMIYINITNFALISSLEKVNSVFEMCRLKTVAIFIQAILSSVLSRIIMSICNSIARKY